VYTNVSQQRWNVNLFKLPVDPVFGRFRRRRSKYLHLQLSLAFQFSFMGPNYRKLHTPPIHMADKRSYCYKHRSFLKLSFTSTVHDRRRFWYILPFLSMLQYKSRRLCSMARDNLLEAHIGYYMFVRDQCRRYELQCSQCTSASRALKLALCQLALSQVLDLSRNIESLTRPAWQMWSQLSLLLQADALFSLLHSLNGS
jgi:hypothetical protein